MQFCDVRAAIIFHSQYSLVYYLRIFFHTKLLVYCKGFIFTFHCLFFAVRVFLSSSGVMRSGPILPNLLGSESEQGRSWDMFKIGQTALH